VAATTLVPGCVSPDGPDPSSPPRPPASAVDYPPLRAGPRGSHAGSFEVAHELVLQGRRDWGTIRDPDPDTYDLVVVGGGISGLSAAYFHLERDPSARILILDNHDDFGGHAKRNEFRLGDRTLIGYGGSQTLEDPQDYSAVAQKLIRDIGVKIDRFDSLYDRDFYRENGLGGGVFFDRAHYGVDRLVRYELIDYSGYMPLSPSKLSAREAVAQMPLSPAAQSEMVALLEAEGDRLAPISVDDQEDYLYTISYKHFLQRYVGITEPEVFALLEGIASDIGVTIEATPAMGALGYVGMPGIRATGLHRYSFEESPYIAHFPDGNASIARLLVRAMIPQVAGPGTGRSRMDEIVGERFDYARLDEYDSPVRLRLQSTVVRVQHEGTPELAERVAIQYVRGGRAERVTARACVLAGYNAMVPHLCPELPEPQREALSLAVKSPILYSNVLLRDWRAWKALGIAAVSAPGSYHTNAMLDFPVSMGGYAFPESPDEPIVVHMERFGKVPNEGATPRQQYQAERHHLFTTPFESIEREIRTQLAGTLAGGGFDPARDIEAITVNRWAHGYAYMTNLLFDPNHWEDPDVVPPYVTARARFGRIAIANSDAAYSPSIDAAIDEADRAIRELAER